MSSSSQSDQLADLLLARQPELVTRKVVTGFDGFVDEMISVVGTRNSLQSFERIPTIPDFADAVAGAAGRSSLREIVIHEARPGGCAVNMGDGLARMGVSVQTYATVGAPLHSAFVEYAERAQLTSWGEEPGRTLAFEFSDGKLMFSAVEQLQKFTPENLEGYLADGAFLNACAESLLIAITDWTLYPHMTACWRFLCEQVFSKLTDPVFFFDLVDPSGRSETDILDMLAALEHFASLGETTLGVNQNEADVLCGILKLEKGAGDPGSAKAQAERLRERIGVQRVVQHATRYAAESDVHAKTAVLGPYCENPRTSTGAGDRFNAGWAIGRILNLGQAERLRLATASSGYFVREGRSPDLPQIADFLRQHQIPLG